MNKEHFYTNLPIQTKSVNALLQNAKAFQRLPAEWFIINTDIKGSTIAVKNGQSELVNLVATGSIIAALNIAANKEIDIPFFFGGDGATIVVPSSLLNEIMTALTLHQSNVKKEFKLDLRVGNLSVAAVYEKGYELKIARTKINKLFSIPIVLGNGLQYAEKAIKAKAIVFQDFPEEKTFLNLEGMECRWNKILPPANAAEVVCLLINAVKEAEQAIVFKKVLDQTDAIYGPHKKRNPISLARLKLNTGLQKIKMELKARRSGFGIREWLKNWIYVIGGRYWYLPSIAGKKYLKELVQLSDIFVLDGRISMVISGKPTQRQKLVQFLDKMEANKEILYGIYVCKDSVISCYVRDREANHIHFIDGGDGGYTKAAVLLKEKMRGMQ